MIEKNDIIKITKHLIKKSSGIPDRRIMHPARDWFVGLGVSAVIFILSLMYAGYQFITISEQTDRIISVESSVVRYNQKGVQDAIEYYKNKEDKFNRLRTEEYRIVSPIPEEAVSAKDESAENVYIESKLAEDLKYE